MEAAHRHVVPRTLAYAAAAYGQNPRALGEILIALVLGGEEQEWALDEGQRAIVAMCREEVAERERVREQARERKARERKARERRARPSARDEEALARDEEALDPASTTTEGERTIWP